MTKNLTEAWKNGELEEGEYYVKLESGKIDIYFMVYDDDDCDEIVEIIAPVPSYEELEQLKAENRALAMGSFPMMIEAAKKIDELKELLKKCQGVLLTYSNMHGNYELYDKINKVLK